MHPRRRADRSNDTGACVAGRRADPSAQGHEPPDAFRQPVPDQIAPDQLAPNQLAPDQLALDPAGGRGSGFVHTADAATALPGAYLLLISLPGPLAVVLAQRPAVILPPGQYLYAGSAFGPGGLRARLARHMRGDKKPHWHIDRLTAAGRVEGAWTVPGGRECDLVAALAHLPVPLPGFGSTDCRRCVSHLLAWPDDPGRRWALPCPSASDGSDYAATA